MKKLKFYISIAIFAFGATILAQQFCCGQSDDVVDLESLEALSRFESQELRDECCDEAQRQSCNLTVKDVDNTVVQISYYNYKIKDSEYEID